MSTKATDRFETLAIHAGQSPDPTTGAVMTPVYLTSTYVQSGPGEHKGFEYSRTRNPTRDALQGCLAALENGTHALAFASSLTASAGARLAHRLPVAVLKRIFAVLLYVLATRMAVHYW